MPSSTLWRRYLPDDQTAPTHLTTRSRGLHNGDPVPSGGLTFDGNGKPPAIHDRYRHRGHLPALTYKATDGTGGTEWKFVITESVAQGATRAISSQASNQRP